MGTGPLALYNCMDRDVYVEVDGEQVVLPRLPCPQIVDQHDDASPLQVLVGDRHTTLRLETGHVRATLFLPEPVDGVRYLVPVEVLLRLTHRSDLVTPALYRLVWPTDPTSPDDAPSIRLSAVAANLLPAGDETPNIEIDDIDDEWPS